MQLIIGFFGGGITVAVFWLLCTWAAENRRERYEAKYEIASRTGPHRIIPAAYPADPVDVIAHGGAHRKGGRRG